MTSNDATADQARAASSRRRFLKGLGLAVALPAMESLLPKGLNAAFAGSTRPLGASTTGAPLRAAFLYVPNGVNQKAWWPTGEGSAFELGRTMQPLASLKDKIQVFGGLDLGRRKRLDRKLELRSGHRRNRGRHRRSRGSRRPG